MIRNVNIDEKLNSYLIENTKVNPEIPNNRLNNKGIITVNSLVEGLIVIDGT